MKQQKIKTKKTLAYNCKTMIMNSVKFKKYIFQLKQGKKHDVLSYYKKAGKQVAACQWISITSINR